MEKTEIELLKDDKLSADIKQELLKYGINIDSNGVYFQNKNYNIFLTKYLDIDGFRFLSYDYYIEKIIIGQSKLNTIKKGKFNVGTQKIIPLEKISEKELYYEIYDEIVGDDTDPESDTDKIKGIRNKFYGGIKKGGIIDQLEEIFGFKLEDFDDKYSKFKFMKLMYVLSKTKMYGESVNFYLMFQKPTFENVDKTVYAEANRNGKNIAILKNELIKEVPLEKVRSLNLKLIEMTNNWERLLGVSARYAYEHNTENLWRLAEFLEKKVVNLLPEDSKMIVRKCREPLFDIIYFKVLQLEYISIKTDFVRINNETLQYVKQKRNMISGNSSEEVKRNLLKSYIKSRKEVLAKYLVEPDFSEHKAVLFIDENARNTIILVEWFEQSYDIDFSNRVPVLLLISILLAIRDASKNDEAMEYSYYRALQTGNMRLVDKLSRGKKSEEVYHRLWAKKVHFIHSCLCGMGQEAEYNIRIEKALDTIMSFLMNYHNLDDFEFCNDHIFDIVMRSFVLDELALKNIKHVADGIAALTGYKTEILHRNPLKLFKMMTENYDFNPFIEGFVDDIRKIEAGIVEVEYHKIIELIKYPSGIKLGGIFKVRVNQDRKVLQLLDYHDISPDEECEKLRSLGFEKMVWMGEDDVKEYTPEEQGQLYCV
ncbi:hypothetical protein [Lachnoclostridium phytofermentans]|uniref:hypothetical protein n=1 Tax=Lachnoclostridium phytofermentans TaxID=66219 RepID=UPI0004DF0A79|nr:hypothetical protein [Lachnoclostridium phytofermentans]